jgi:hypothetical protein
MATAVELDDSQAGGHDRMRHELSPALIVPPAPRETPTPLACDMMCPTQRNIASGFIDATTMRTSSVMHAGRWSTICKALDYWSKTVRLCLIIAVMQ